MTAAVTLLCLAVRGWTPTPEEEVRFWAVLHGVKPEVALAVADVESGRAPESRRDLVVSRGNYGRFQVRCTTWRAYFGLRDCSDLLDRHRNIRLGVRILRMVQDRFASRDGRGCRCRSGAAHHWTAHYNEGISVMPEGRGEAYGRLVAARARRLERFGHSARLPGLLRVLAARISSVWTLPFVSRATDTTPETRKDRPQAPR